jgi:hypothetical protein
MFSRQWQAVLDFDPQTERVPAGVSPGRMPPLGTGAVPQLHALAVPNTTITRPLSAPMSIPDGLVRS